MFKTALDELAENCSTEDVVKFLQSFGMDQYVDIFRDRVIDGRVLVVFGDEDLIELGILSPLHRFKIQFLFKRFLQSIRAKHAMVVVRDFLIAYKMETYVQKFTKEEVDGDMLLEILHLTPDVGDPILKYLGVESKVDRIKMRQQFKP